MEGPNKPQWLQLTILDLKDQIFALDVSEVRQLQDYVQEQVQLYQVEKKRAAIYQSLASWTAQPEIKVSVRMNKRTNQLLFVDVTRRGQLYRFSKKIYTVRNVHYLACNGQPLALPKPLEVCKEYPAGILALPWATPQMVLDLFDQVMFGRADNEF